MLLMVLDTYGTIEGCSRKAMTVLLSKSDESDTDDSPLMSSGFRFTSEMRYGLPGYIKVLQIHHDNLCISIRLCLTKIKSIFL